MAGPGVPSKTKVSPGTAMMNVQGWCLMSDEAMTTQQDPAEILSEPELRLIYSLGRLGHESLPALAGPESVEVARGLARRGLLSAVEGSDPRVKRFGAYVITALGFEAFNRRVCRRSRALASSAA